MQGTNLNYYYLVYYIASLLLLCILHSIIITFVHYIVLLLLITSYYDYVIISPIDDQAQDNDGDVELAHVSMQNSSSAACLLTNEVNIQSSDSNNVINKV